MGKKEKLIQRLLRKPKDFTYSELATLLEYLGFNELRKSKTSGSRRAFVHRHSKHIIRLHKPHPNEILKRYQINQVISDLKNEGLI